MKIKMVVSMMIDTGNCRQKSKWTIGEPLLSSMNKEMPAPTTFLTKVLLYFRFFRTWAMIITLHNFLQLIPLDQPCLSVRLLFCCLLKLNYRFPNRFFLASRRPVSVKFHNPAFLIMCSRNVSSLFLIVICSFYSRINFFFPKNW